MTRFILGQLVRLSAEFRDPESNTLLDPDTVRLRVRNPLGASALDETFGVGSAIVRLSQGRYIADVDASESGSWTYYWNSEGLGQAAAEGTFDVRVARALL